MEKKLTIRENETVFICLLPSEYRGRRVRHLATIGSQWHRCLIGDSMGYDGDGLTAGEAYDNAVSEVRRG